jgi:hypothetical protein
MREFGGYLPLELKEGQEMFDRYEDAKVARFNSGRASIVAAVKAVKPSKLYIPLYNCAVVRKALEDAGFTYSFYNLNADLEPDIDSIEDDAWLLYVHYFGIASDEKISTLAGKYKNVIFDNTQAFYAKPVLDDNCMNVYSPRKFVGLVDGGYLVWSGKREVSEDYPQDVSWGRASFLFKSIELGTNAAYQDNLDSKVCLADGVKRMSVMTRKMLKSLDYDDLAERRDRNYRVLIERFRNVNQLRLPMNGYAPFVYPLVVENPALRSKVVGNKIYTPQWWKYLLDEVPSNSIEAWLSQWLLPLPVDHRYTEGDMEEMADEIILCINSTGEK